MISPQFRIRMFANFRCAHDSRCCSAHEVVNQPCTRNPGRPACVSWLLYVYRVCVSQGPRATNTASGSANRSRLGITSAVAAWAGYRSAPASSSCKAQRRLLGGGKAAKTHLVASAPNPRLVGLGLAEVLEVHTEVARLVVGHEQRQPLRLRLR